MTGAWVLRWDTAGEPRPRLVHGTDLAPAAPGGSGFTVVHGYLFDRDRLAAGGVGSDAGRVASAYQRWGGELCDKLRGGFALAVWDEERRRLLVGRDAMGLVPCFYWWNGRLLVASPSIDGILAQPEVDVRFNRVLIAEYLENVRGYQQLDETFYEDVHRLPAAHTLTLSGTTLSVSRYWDPIPPGFAWATEEEVSGFAAALGAAVERSLSAGADSLALSGGFDSVCLAAVAVEHGRGRAPLHAVSLRFTHPSCDEGERQRAVARTLGMPHLMRSLDECLDDDALVGELRTLSRISPGPVMSAWQPMYLRLLRTASERGLSRLMLGTGGDEMFHVNMGYPADCLGALSLKALWRFCRACQVNWPGAPVRVAWGVIWRAAIMGHLGYRARTLLETFPQARGWIVPRRRRRRRPSWLGADAALAERLDRRPLEASRVPTAPGEGAYVRALRALPQSPSFSLEFEQSHAWAAHAGFTFLFPYFDRDLVELSLRLPPAHLVAGGRAKAPLRRLVAERLPQITVPGGKVLFGRQFDPLFRVHGRRAWAALGGPVALAGLGVVDAPRVRALMDDYFAGRSSQSLTPWLLLSMEAWLQARGATGQ